MSKMPLEFFKTCYRGFLQVHFVGEGENAGWGGIDREWKAASNNFEKTAEMIWKESPSLISGILRLSAKTLVLCCTEPSSNVLEERKGTIAGFFFSATAFWGAQARNLIFLTGVTAPHHNPNKAYTSQSVV